MLPIQPLLWHDGEDVKLVGWEEVSMDEIWNLKCRLMHFGVLRRDTLEYRIDN